MGEYDGIKNPKTLTSMKFRRDIAALLTVLNLQTTELDLLADFLGHKIEIHREQYHLSKDTLQVVKITFFYSSFQTGRARRIPREEYNILTYYLLITLQKYKKIYIFNHNLPFLKSFSLVLAKPLHHSVCVCVCV